MIIFLYSFSSWSLLWRRYGKSMMRVTVTCAYTTMRIIDRTVYFSLSHLTPRQFPRHAYTARYSLLLPALSPTSYNSGHKLFADSEFSVHGNGEANVGRGHPSSAYLYPIQDLWFQPCTILSVVIFARNDSNMIILRLLLRRIFSVL